MGKGNIYNDIQKGLYDLAINEINEIKKQSPFLVNSCDQLIELIGSYKNGSKKYKKDWQPILEKIILN